MHRLLIPVLLALSDCATAQTQSVLEDVALKETPKARPTCEAGHEGALQDGRLTIRPGETICVALEVKDGALVSRAVVSIDDPRTTLIVKAWQEPGKPDTFMSLRNPLKTNLRYEASMVRLGQSAGEYTSSCPVLSGRLAFEHWPYAIAAFQLSAFRSEPESQSVVCR